MNLHSPAAIRHARLDEADALADLATRTFADAFGTQNDPEDLRHHLEEHCAPATILSQLAAEGWTTLVGELEGRLVAYAQLCDGPPPMVLAASHPRRLYRIYLDRACWGTGLAQQLLAATIEEASGRGADALWLTTWDRNARGLAFYRKSGFREVGTTVFTVGRDPQRDLVLVLSLA